ncbi:hypothetical protein RND81_12G039400 [Saponaria officinalis]|uniref:Kinesin motor domain-containing protein n=1 Tax=Saponaria officinalis TaxID=3572 RepID=A0AAW1H554_SAPOF
MHKSNLLDPTRQNLKIKDEAKVGFHVENLTKDYVTCYDDVTQLLIKGLSSRKFGATSMNSESCRSHTVFTCVIESWSKETSSNDYSSSKTSRISFVDLAGLVKDKQVDAEREFEKKRKDLESSLSHLGYDMMNNMLYLLFLNGILILTVGTQPDEAMYKDSSLIHILQQSLGGNAKLVVISIISLDIKLLQIQPCHLRI